MSSHLRRAAARFFGLARLPALALLVAWTVSSPAQADVNLRVVSRPQSEPIQVFVTVTSGGNPVSGLQAGDFTVTIDGPPAIAIAPGDLTLPPSQDPNQKVSVVFAMDYSRSVRDAYLATMQQAVIEFAAAMNDGDQVAIVKFNDSPSRATVVLPFTTVDHAANTAAIDAAVMADYEEGIGTPLLDALVVSVDHFINPPSALPSGPKAVVLISDGGENESDASLDDVIALANANGIPIFTIGVGDLDEPGREELMTSIGFDTGGDYHPTANEQDIHDAYASISQLLANEYLITIPNGIADCDEHVLEVAVTGDPNPATANFTRRTCDTAPDPFDFGAVTGVARGEIVTSDPQEITGIEVPAHISVISGNYSISDDGTCGATDGDYTNTAGTISNGQTVCIRQAASPQASTTKVTTLTIGGVAGTFSTTTVANNNGGGGGGGGGGGATGVFDLLLGLAALLLGRRRLAA